MQRTLALLLLVAACEKPGVHATREQCERMSAELEAAAGRINARHDPWYKVRTFGSDSSDVCVERMTAQQVDCVIARYRADQLDTSGCKP